LFGYGLLLPALIVIGLVILYPMADAIHMSFFETGLLQLGPPRYIGLDNYTALFQNAAFSTALQNTVIWTIVNLIAQVTLGTALAILLNEPLRGRALFRAVALIPWIVPSVAAALIWRYMYDPTSGLINSLLIRLGIIHANIVWLGETNTALNSVMLESIWKGTPFVMIIMLAALQAIPHELYEAGEIDGAGALQRFWYVVLPQVRASLALAAILTIVYTVNNFNAIWLMTQGGPLHSTDILFTLAYEIAFTQFDFGSAAALSVLLFVILLIIGSGYIFLVEREERSSTP